MGEPVEFLKQRVVGPRPVDQEAEVEVDLGYRGGSLNESWTVSTPSALRLISISAMFAFWSNSSSSVD